MSASARPLAVSRPIGPPVGESRPDSPGGPGPDGPDGPGGPGGEAANEASATIVASVDDSGVPGNLVKRTVDEVLVLLEQINDMRDNLIARDVQFHMLNALIELGVQDKFDEQEKMAATMVEASVRDIGSRAITLPELLEKLATIAELQKQRGHVLHLAKEQGVHMQALNQLTQLMRMNPGDRGVQSINTFIAYADAAGIPLDRASEIRAQVANEAKSVLPNIPREFESDGADRLRETTTNVVVGLVLTIIVMWMVL